VCSGSVVVVDEKNQLKLTSETLFYDRTDKISRIEGPSVMEDKKNKMVIKEASSRTTIPRRLRDTDRRKDFKGGHGVPLGIRALSQKGENSRAVRMPPYIGKAMNTKPLKLP